jgi:hypothetical protein
MNVVTRKLKQRRNEREFERAVCKASPSMRQELLAAATRDGYRH